MCLLQSDHQGKCDCLADRCQRSYQTFWIYSQSGNSDIVGRHQGFHVSDTAQSQQMSGKQELDGCGLSAALNCPAVLFALIMAWCGHTVRTPLLSPLSSTALTRSTVIVWSLCSGEGMMYNLKLMIYLFLEFSV